MPLLPLRVQKHNKKHVKRNRGKTPGEQIPGTKKHRRTNPDHEKQLQDRRKTRSMQYLRGDRVGKNMQVLRNNKPTKIMMNKYLLFKVKYINVK